MWEDLYGEQACTGNEYCVVFLILYIHLGHNEVIRAGQKLYRYTKFGNTLKKTVFPQDSPQNSYQGESVHL